MIQEATHTSCIKVSVILMVVEDCAVSAIVPVQTISRSILSQYNHKNFVLINAIRGIQSGVCCDGGSHIGYIDRK